MNIIVCIKQVPETFKTNVNENNSPMQGIMNPFDTYALEEGVRIKEKVGGSVTTISMGIESVKETLKESIALGADNAILLNDSSFAGSDTLATGYVLSKAIEKIGKYDIIICGKQSTNGDTAQVGPSLAAKLGIPFATNVIELELIKEEAIQCKSLTETGYKIVEMKLPALITVCKGINEPRLPTIKGIIKAKEAQIDLWNADDINANTELCGLNGSPTKVVRTYNPPTFQINGEQIEGSAEEQAKKLANILISMKNTALDDSLHESGIEKLYATRSDEYKRDNNEVWIYCEMNCGKIASVVPELLGKGRELADKLDTYLAAVLIGNNVPNAANDLIAYGADKVYLIEHQSLEIKNEIQYGNILVQLVYEKKPQIFLIGATVHGRAIAPWIASVLNTGLTADCTELNIEDETNVLLQTRPIFGGNIMADIKCINHRPQMATVRPKVMKAADADNSKVGEIIRQHVIIHDNNRIKIVDEINEPKRHRNISEADIVVAGGKGISGKDGFKMLEKLADYLGGALGATRAAVDAGWVEFKHQIGQTGVTVRPKIYLACGISGAIQHLVGMASSDVIIAINNNPDAPILKIAHYRIIGDINEIVPMLIKELEKQV